MHIYTKVFPAHIFCGADQRSVADLIGHISIGIKLALLLGQVHIPVLHILQQQTAGKTAGPAVFVICPGVHTQLFSLVAAGLDTLHPFLT